MAARAVTGVLQGIATGNVGQAVVGGLSPYANKLIKEATTDQSGQVNKEANLMAHALLGAIEAYATGNHAGAGAAGAVTGELAAELIIKQLYDKNSPDELTEAQKQTVTALSQLASGLLGGLVGDSTSSAISAAEIGKRAVENNYLSKEEAKALVSKYEAADSPLEKLKILYEYLAISKHNDEIFDSVCANNPVLCLELISEAQDGSVTLMRGKDKFASSPEYLDIQVSNARAGSNTEWTEFHWSNLIPSQREITPNQELADQLAKAISEGRVLLTKKSADLLYQLNTNPDLVVLMDPSSVSFVRTKDWENLGKGERKAVGRVSYLDGNNWSILGSIAVKQRNNGEYHLFDDVYDYDMHSFDDARGYWDKIKIWIRNMETKQGEPGKGGTSFNIKMQDKPIKYQEN